MRMNVDNEYCKIRMQVDEHMLLCSVNWVAIVHCDRLSRLIESFETSECYTRLLSLCISSLPVAKKGTTRIACNRPLQAQFFYIC